MERAVRCVAELFQLPIRLSEASEAEGREALELGVKHSKQHADMTYVRLAERLDCRWCTADEKFLRALQVGFPRNRVVELSSLRRAD
jgi:predicted nucleic acid-binding protein